MLLPIHERNREEFDEIYKPNQKQIKFITNPNEDVNLRNPNEHEHLLDDSNYLAQCCVAACLDLPFINKQGFKTLIPKLSDIPEIISNMKPETGYFHYISPFNYKFQTNWLDWFFYTPEDKVKAHELHNLEKIYQMTGSIPKEFVPYIPEEKIFINPIRVETGININYHNEVGCPIIYNEETKTWEFEFTFSQPRERDDEPENIELVKNKPAKLTEMEMMIIGKYVGIKDLENIRKTNKEYVFFCKLYNKIPNDIDEIEDLDKFELKRIIDSNFEIQGNGVYEPLSIHEAHFMVCFLLYMNEICKEMGYPKTIKEGKRNKQYWKSKLTKDSHSSKDGFGTTMIDEFFFFYLLLLFWDIPFLYIFHSYKEENIP